MIIDAMDILHSDKVDGFCLVSSDSDFTRLAVRLRESSMLVIGIGEKKTPKPFIVACDKFIYIEILGNSEVETSDTQQDSTSLNQSKTDKDSNIEPINKKLIQLLKNTVQDLADDDGWAFLGDMGNLIIKKRPDFDPRNYGYPKLTPMIKSLNKIFDIDVRVADKKHIKHIYVKIKE